MIDPARGLHLGKQGEKQADWLLNLQDFSRGAFTVCMLCSPHPQALAELQRRLRQAAPHLRVWKPGSDLLERARELAKEIGAEDPSPVIWLQVDDFNDPEEEMCWRHGISRLHTARDIFREEAPWLWIMAGPMKLHLIAQEIGPDLLSVTKRMFIENLPQYVRWLHLSDLHLRSDKHWHGDAVLEALLRRVETFRDEDLAPDLVLITGDLAHSGKRKEYDQAMLFLEKLGETLELPRERFFVVPGNHDVDRSRIGPADDLIFAGLDRERLDQTLMSPPTMELLGRRLDEFYFFTERHLGAARGWTAQRPWRVDVVDIRGVEMAIVQLNSAWASGSKDDRGKLLVGEAQVRDALDQAASAHLRVVMVHHPLADLKEFDASRLETLLPAPGGAHFLLSGHLHRPLPRLEAMPGTSMARLQAGTTHVFGDHPKSFYLTEVDLTAHEARVHVFRYEDEGRGHWQRWNVFEGMKDGTWRFPLPDALRVGAPSDVPEERREARRESALARYRQTVVRVHGAVRFIGYDAAAGGRPNVPVPELFVPLRMERRTQGEGDVLTTTDLLRGLMSERRRIVVLGDPGAGKTTLCRFAAAVLAGCDLRDDGADLRIDAPADLVPMFIPFRDYVTECGKRDLSLLEYVKSQARSHLQLTLPERFFEDALEDGRCVVLLDGLDEVGSTEDRVRMLERVTAFLGHYGKASALVTSRIVGYDEARLPDRGGEAFETFELRPFSDEDLERFVALWYEVQEPENPQIREEYAGRLLEALRAQDRLRQLARNPMLATLLAMVHRVQADLPGERAELYEICVKTMLKYWPKQRRRRFLEIDEGLQRMYLEELALRMQMQRASKELSLWDFNLVKNSVEIERSALVETLTEIIAERQGDMAWETLRERTEEWVCFLEEGTGLLVQQKPGIFSFFHLSLMEYLASQALGRRELVDEICEHFSDERWREVCLLAVGSRATDKEFLDALFQCLSKEYGWVFLLECMGEEAAFSDAQRAEILRSAVDLVKVNPATLNTPDTTVALSEVFSRGRVRRIIRKLLRFSSRHAKWLRLWIVGELNDYEENFSVNKATDYGIMFLLEFFDDPGVAQFSLDLFPPVADAAGLEE